MIEKLKIIQKRDGSFTPKTGKNAGVKKEGNFYIGIDPETEKGKEFWSNKIHPLGEVVEVDLKAKVQVDGRVSYSEISL